MTKSTLMQVPPHPCCCCVWSLWSWIDKTGYRQLFFNLNMRSYESDGRSRNSTLIQFSDLELYSIAMIYITVCSPPREMWSWWPPHPWSGMLLDTGHGGCVCINILIKVPFICFIIHGCEENLTHYKAVDLITSTYLESESLFGYMEKKNGFHSGCSPSFLVWENSA